MAKTRERKEADVAKMTELFANTKLAVLTDYRGLDVPAINELRAKLREAGITYTVAKNTLVKLALANSPQKSADTTILSGPMAIAFGADEVDAAKIVADFAKEYEALDILGAIAEDGSVLTKAEVKALASLPSREQLTAQLVGTIAAPLSGFVRLLNGNVASVVYALGAIKDKKIAEAEVAAA